MIDDDALKGDDHDDQYDDKWRSTESDNTAI